MSAVLVCRKPYTAGSLAFKCGRCVPCRVYRRRVWQHRMLLEATQHTESSFVTLTYSDEWLPVKKGIPTLVPKHAQDWMKRLRRKLEPQRIRYFMVGEYGKDVPSGVGGYAAYGRPHYHALVYGLGGCVFGQSSIQCRCPSCSLVRETWGFGLVHVGEVNAKTCGYVAGYTVKKLGSDSVPGRVAPFQRMSLKPGIGEGAVNTIAESMLATQADIILDDVPSQLRHGERLMPLGPYLRKRLRLALGRPSETPPEVLREIQERLLPVFAAQKTTPDGYSKLLAEIAQGDCERIESMTRQERSKL